MQGILSPRMFTMLLLMALATTCMTTPAVSLLYRGRRHELEGEGNKHQQPLSPPPAAVSAGLADSSGGGGVADGIAAEARARARSSSSIVFVYKSSRGSETGDSLISYASPAAASTKTAAGCVSSSAAAGSSSGDRVALTIPQLSKDLDDRQRQDA
jgi:hypothetical protein